MVSRETALRVTCPTCGAGPGAACLIGHRGKARDVQHPRRISRVMEERDFWDWVDRRLSDPDCAGLTEQQFLDRISLPGWTGRKARNRSAAPNSACMPIRDFRMAAAGDSDEAA